MATRSLLRRATPLLFRQLHLRTPAFPLFRPLSTINDAVPLHTKAFSSCSSVVEPPPPNTSTWKSGADPKEWSTVEAEIDEHVQSMISFARSITSKAGRYADGERLSDEDEKVILEKFLRYHPCYEDKIGSGLDYMVVDRHNQYKYTRCLFMVRTDGTWEDFSYFKCIGAYIQDKYPSYADRYFRQRIKQDGKGFERSKTWFNDFCHRCRYGKKKTFG